MAKGLTFGVSRPTEMAPLWSTVVMVHDENQLFEVCPIAAFPERNQALKLAVLNYATIYFVDVKTIGALKNRPLLQPAQAAFCSVEADGGWDVVMALAQTERKICRFDGIEYRRFT